MHVCYFTCVKDIDVNKGGTILPNVELIKVDITKLNRTTDTIMEDREKQINEIQHNMPLTKRQNKKR